MVCVNYLEKWWAGTGLNRRHQDFQFSLSIVRSAHPASELRHHGHAGVVAPCCGQLRPAAGWQQRALAWLVVRVTANPTVFQVRPLACTRTSRPLASIGSRDALGCASSAFAIRSYRSSPQVARRRLYWRRVSLPRRYR
jgi:hypothetical protein